MCVECECVACVVSVLRCGRQCAEYSECAVAECARVQIVCAEYAE